MPTIGNAPLGEDSSIDESEKLPVSGSKWMSLATIVEYLRTKAQTLTNKTLTAPTIADFTNMAHDHGDANDGGVLVAAAISGLLAYPGVLTHAAHGPTDATTIFFGDMHGVTPTTTAAIAKHYFFKSGTINKLRLQAICAAGSNEAGTAYIRLNNTTDYQITGALDYSSTNQEFNVTTLGVPIAAGDYIEAKIVYPTWVTNPTSVRHAVEFVLESVS